MNWSHIDYPEPMRKLEPDIRTRAIDIANKLIDEGMEAELAITNAIQRAEAWADYRKDPAESNKGEPNGH